MSDINEALRDHCTSTAVADWDGKEWARELHAWFERFSTAFGLDLATPAIHIGPSRSPRAALYRPERNGFGLRQQITFNRKKLQEPLALILVELLREALREWQAIHSKPTRRSVYNRELRGKAAGLGVDFDRSGRLVAVRAGEFKRLLENHRVEAAGLTCRELAPKKRRKFRQWMCSCMSFPAPVELCGRCEVCGQRYEPVEERKRAQAGKETH